LSTYFIEKSLDESIKTCFKYIFEYKKNSPKYFMQTIMEYIETESIYQAPTNVLLKVTSACNLRCKHCFYYSDQQSFNPCDDLTTEELLELAKFLIEELTLK